MLSVCALWTIILMVLGLNSAAGHHPLSSCWRFRLGCNHLQSEACQTQQHTLKQVCVPNIQWQFPLCPSGVCCEVQIEVYVDKSTAAKLNSGEEKLEDILVLHLTNGKDSFVSFYYSVLVSLLFLSSRQLWAFCYVSELVNWLSVLTA